MTPYASHWAATCHRAHSGPGARAGEQIPIKTAVSFPVYGFFDRIRDGKYMMAEDYSFCQRWIDCGDEVWGG
jgi:hypothetical protein